MFMSTEDARTAYDPFMENAEIHLQCSSYQYHD